MPRKTINERGAKTIWVKCANKDRERATATLLGVWNGNKYPPFVMFKSMAAKKAATQLENNRVHNGFGTRVWK